MPLNRPALTLGRGPRGVQDARRWVVDSFADIGRDELVECAEMGVSELVTNALLHGSGQIQVRVRGTREHPRVEVHDESTDAPQLPSEATEYDELLLTFGRGLSIVARASDAWGAEIEDDGKVVWFAPSPDFSEEEGPEGTISGVTMLDLTGEHATDAMQVDLCCVPVADYVSFQHHFRELRREVRLLSLAHESDYPLAKDLSEVFSTHGRTLGLGSDNDAVARAQAAGEQSLDLARRVSRRAAREIGRFVDLLDLTDAFGREEKMLSLARTAEQRDFQNWYLGEFVSQAEGAAARAWIAPVSTQRTRIR